MKRITYKYANHSTILERLSTMKLRCKPLSVFLSFPALVIALILSQVSAQYDVPNIRGAINSDPGAYRDSGAGGTTAAEITSILTDMHRADSGSGLGKLNSIFEQGRKRIRESAIRRNRRRLRDEAVTSESNNDRRRLVPGGDIGERKSAPFQSSRRLCANGDDYVKSIFIITAALSPFWNDTTSTEPLYVAAAEGLAREFTTDLDGTFTITNPELGQRLELKNLFVNLDEAAGDLYLWKQDDNGMYSLPTRMRKRSAAKASFNPCALIFSTSPAVFYDYLSRGIP